METFTYFCRMKNLAVITGASKGIGLAITKKFLAQGFEVAICARNLESLVQIQNQYGKEKVHIFSADLSQKEQVFNFANFVKHLAIPIKVLVNNAGIFIPGSLLEEDHLQIHLDTNLWSAYYLTKALIPSLQESYIFNICSIASLAAYPRSGSYAISKFALLGFTKSLRQELLGSKIRVSAVLPGATLTDSWEGTTLPSERFISPKDVAEMIWAAYGLSPSACVEEIIIRPQQGDI